MLEEVYLRLPRLGQTLAVSALGLKNRLKRYGSSFRKHRGFLEGSESWSRAQIRQWQNEELVRLLRHAVGTVPHYRSLAKDSPYTSDDVRGFLRTWPLLEKRSIRAAPQHFVSEAFRAKDVLSVMTTGTTGSPTTFIIDHTSRQQHFAYFDRLLRWAGLDSGEWHAVFMGRVLGTSRQMRRQPWRIDYANRRVYYSSYDISKDTIEAYANHFARQRFEWVEGYPSAIANLARLAQEANLDLPHPGAIIPSSETLDDATRRSIETCFGQRIWEFYAAAEQAVFISQCGEGSLHINPEYGIVELEPQGHDQDGNLLYEMVATSFRNWAMPLVRYRTDDLVTTESEPCPCGRAFPRVGRIVGRTSGTVILPDGRRVTGVSNVPKGLPIRESQLVQIADDALEFRVVPLKSEWTSAAEAAVLRRLRDRLGDSVKLSVRLVRHIERGPGGKSCLVRKL